MKMVLGPTPVIVVGVLLSSSACGLQEYPHHAATSVQGNPDTGGTGPGGTGTGGSRAGGTGGADIGPQTGGESGGVPEPDAAADPGDAGPNDPPRDAARPRDTAVPTGPTINIGGTEVPRDRAIVFIHFGHSNMAGLAQSPNSLRPYFFTTQAQLWSYQGGGRFVAAKEPTAPDPPVHLGAGPGMAWLRAAAAAAGPDYHFISVARGRGGATTADYLKGGLYYSTFMDRAMELKGKVTFGGLFIMMGITDRHLPPAEQDGFTDRMVKIIADIRADLGEPNLPVLHTDYEVEATGELAITAPIGMKFRPQIQRLPMRVTNLAIIPTNGTPLIDDHHFDMTGHKLWADRGIQIMIQRGWFPWAK
jgi:hypothetical protein